MWRRRPSPRPRPRSSTSSRYVELPALPSSLPPLSRPLYRTCFLSYPYTFIPLLCFSSFPPFPSFHIFSSCHPFCSPSYIHIYTCTVSSTPVHFSLSLSISLSRPPSSPCGSFVSPSRLFAVNFSPSLPPSFRPSLAHFSPPSPPARKPQEPEFRATTRFKEPFAWRRV